MTEFKKPYVGVSGVVSPEVERDLEKIHLKSGLAEKERLLALGVKAVHKTQFLDVENKYGRDWYPVGSEAFQASLRSDSRSPVVMPVAQMYLDVNHVADPAYRESFVARTVERGSPWLQGIQFDLLPWHNNDDMLPFIEHVKDSSELEILIQVHGHAMNELGPDGVMKRLGRTAARIDYLLFDSSHGTGTRLDVEALRPFIQSAYEYVDPRSTGIAIAGGLNAQVVTEDLPALVASYPDLSWDAEGQLHPERADGTRPLDIERTREYLLASSSLIPEPARDPYAIQRAILSTEMYWNGGLSRRPPFPHC